MHRPDSHRSFDHHLGGLAKIVVAAMLLVVSTTRSVADDTSRSDNSHSDNSRPNILWLTSEDNGPQLGCYGDTYADTPNLDALASRSMIYRTCWSNAPVCAPARTTLITGMYATSIGGQHMRSGVTLPPEVKLYPQLFRDAGYYCTNNNKTDYNLIASDGKPIDAGWHDSSRKAHYRNRPDASTPFFAVFNSTISHESKIRVRPHTAVHDPADAPVPAYHPDRPEVRRDWAQYYDKMTAMDRELGKHLRELAEAGLNDSTIIFYYGDHGSGMPRSKRWPFDSGLRVPLIVHIPEKFKHLRPQNNPDGSYAAGGMTDRLASFVDLAPTALSMAGIEPPESMQGEPLAGPFESDARSHVFGFRGRMDERIDGVRSSTDGRYVYMRHFYPDRPYLKHVAYMFETPTTRLWKEMFDAGKLNPVQSKVWQNKPIEELFDLNNDPDEVNNLADAPEHAQRLAAMRRTTIEHMKRTGDLGVYPEAEMHRAAGDRPPRMLFTDDPERHADRIDLAFDAMTPDGLSQTGGSSRLIAKRLRDEDPLVRFYAARAIATHSKNLIPLAVAVLEAEPSPSVRVALADAMLHSDNAADVDAAIDSLINDANADATSQYAALEALNVLDMNASLNDAQRERIASLPESATPPPKRAEKYVSHLLKHILNTKP